MASLLLFAHVKRPKCLLCLLLIVILAIERSSQAEDACYVDTRKPDTDWKQTAVSATDSPSKESLIGLERSRPKKQSDPCLWKESDNIWNTPGYIHKTMQANTFASWYNTMVFTEKVAQPPYIVILDTFITMHEAKYMIVRGHNISWTPSQNANSTYSTALCAEKCQDDIIIQGILRRMELATGIPALNMEDIEIRLYQDGQEKKLDHDYREHEKEEPQGVRVAGFYIFLSSASFDGDESAAMHVPHPPLNAIIRAKLGRAIFWTNVQNSNPNAKEPTMEYAFKPVTVTKSVQYGLMIYLHHRNYKDTRNCHVVLEEKKKGRRGL